MRQHVEDEGRSSQARTIAVMLIGCLCALIVASVSRAVAQQAPTFSARLDAVRVDVLVTDRGEVVRGLQASDFVVLDNGVPQQVDLVSFDQVPLNVVLALDMSGSLTEDDLDQLRVAGHALLDGLTTEDRAALVTFSHAVTLREGLTGDVSRVRAVLDRLDPHGETSLVDATYAALLVGESDVGRSLLVVFTDGLDTSSWLTADAVLDDARRSDAVVYGVAVRSGRRATFLRDVTQQTGGAMVEIESTRDVRDAFLRILDEFRHRYLLSYSPTGVPQIGWHTLDVRVVGRRATVRARAGYMAER